MGVKDALGTLQVMLQVNLYTCIHIFKYIHIIYTFGDFLFKLKFFVQLRLDEQGRFWTNTSHSQTNVETVTFH